MTVLVHSCRANWPEGKQEIEGRLAQERLRLEVHGKPYADAYVDDKAVRFTNWADLVTGFRRTLTANVRPRPRRSSR